MTTAAMVLGVVPLITAAGAGAVSRFQMGIVIAAGLSIGTLFTLFVVPAVVHAAGDGQVEDGGAGRRCRSVRARSPGGVTVRSRTRAVECTYGSGLERTAIPQVRG